MRYAGVLASWAGAGLAGAYLMLCQVGVFRDGIVFGHGFIALAVMILGRRPCWRCPACSAGPPQHGGADGKLRARVRRDQNIPGVCMLGWVIAVVT